DRWPGGRARDLQGPRQPGRDRAGDPRRRGRRRPGGLRRPRRRRGPLRRPGQGGRGGGPPRGGPRGGPRRPAPPGPRRPAGAGGKGEPGDLLWKLFVSMAVGTAVGVILGGLATWKGPDNSFKKDVSDAVDAFQTSQARNPSAGGGGPGAAPGAGGGAGAGAGA